jgi:hypothetical protein
MTPVTAPHAEGRQRAQPAMVVFVLAFLIALGVALSVGLLLFDLPPAPPVDVSQVPCAWVAALPWLLYGAAALAVVATLRQIGRGLLGPSQRRGWRAAWPVVQIIAAAAFSWWVASVVNAILLSVITRVAGCAA